MELRVKLKTNVQSDKGTHKIGSIVDLDEKDAKSLISRGFAEEVKESPLEKVISESRKPAEERDVKQEPKAEEKKAETPKKDETTPVKKAATKAPAKKAAPKKATAKKA